MFFGIIFFQNFVYSQSIDTLKVEADIFEKTIQEIFLKCNETKPNYYNSVDSLIISDNKKSIKVLLEFHDGKKLKVLGFYDNGKKYRETNLNGVNLHGMDTKWYKNGQKEFQCIYENGISIIPELNWYSTGELQISYDKNKEKKTGHFVEWYKSGNLKLSSIEYDTIVLGSIDREYYENGQIERISYINLGKQFFISFYENGQKREEGYVFNGLNSKLGKWQKWYENGNLNREYFYDEITPNQKEGVWTWFDENGDIYKKEIYQNGELVKVEIDKLNLKGSEVLDGVK